MAHKSHARQTDYILAIIYLSCEFWQWKEINKMRKIKIDALKYYIHSFPTVQQNKNEHD